MKDKAYMDMYSAQECLDVAWRLLNHIRPEQAVDESMYMSIGVIMENIYNLRTNLAECLIAQGGKE